MSRREQVFWGWGEPGAGPSLPDHAAGFLREALGVVGRVTSRPAVALEDVRPSRPPALPRRARERLEAIVGEEHVRADDPSARPARGRQVLPRPARAARRGARGGARRGRRARAARPRCRPCCSACSEHGVAVVPFGGGTSVVGGVAPERGALRRGRLARPRAPGPRLLASTSARGRPALQPGLRLPEADHVARRARAHARPLPAVLRVGDGRRLRRRPARPARRRRASAASTTHVRRPALRDAGWARSRPCRVPASAAGPPLRELLVGSEGALGVLTEVTLRRAARCRRPAATRAWFVRSFGEGLRRAARARAGRGGARRRAALRRGRDARCRSRWRAPTASRARWRRAALRARGYGEGCLLDRGLGGRARGRRAPRARRPRGACARAGALAARARAGEAWRAARYARPAPARRPAGPRRARRDARDGDDLGRLERAARATSATRCAARCAATPPLVACHVSHLYPAGASLYFTVLAAAGRATTRPGQWRAAKAAATDAIVAAGATLTHHHAVGRDHAPWLRPRSARWASSAAAVKDRLDPAGIMNPGSCCRLRRADRGRLAARLARAPPLRERRPQQDADGVVLGRSSPWTTTSWP